MTAWQKARQLPPLRRININDIFYATDSAKESGEVFFASNGLACLDLNSSGPTTQLPAIAPHGDSPSNTGAVPPRALFGCLTQAAHEHSEAYGQLYNVAPPSRSASPSSTSPSLPTSFLLATAVTIAPSPCPAHLAPGLSSLLSPPHRRPPETLSEIHVQWRMSRHRGSTLSVRTCPSYLVYNLERIYITPVTIHVLYQVRRHYTQESRNLPAQHPGQYFALPVFLHPHFRCRYSPHHKTGCVKAGRTPC